MLELSNTPGPSFFSSFFASAGAPAAGPDAATGLAAAYASGSSRNCFTSSTWRHVTRVERQSAVASYTQPFKKTRTSLKVKSMSAIREATLRKALPNA